MFACFSKRYYLFQHPIVIFQVLVVTRLKGLQMLKLILFFGLSVTTVFIICVIIDFRVLFHPRYSFYFVCWKSILIWVICVSISLIYSPSLIYAFLLFTCEYMCSFLTTDMLTNIFINFFYVTVISNNIVFYISVWRS
jgi:hypothetical protein